MPRPANDMDEVNPAYVHARHDLLDLIPQRSWSAVLDLGCSNGATGVELKRRHAATRVTGVESFPTAARQASQVLDRVLVGDALEQLGRLRDEGARFDLIVCGDVLEHLEDPWSALRLVRELCPEGWVAVSLPNVAHISTIWALLTSRWPYRDRGILDRTHLRFFGRKDLPGLFGSAGLDIAAIRTRHRLFDSPRPVNAKLEPFLSRLPLVRRLTAYQFLCLLEPSPEPKQHRTSGS